MRVRCVHVTLRLQVADLYSKYPFTKTLFYIFKSFNGAVVIIKILVLSSTCITQPQANDEKSIIKIAGHKPSGSWSVIQVSVITFSFRSQYLCYNCPCLGSPRTSRRSIFGGLEQVPHARLNIGYHRLWPMNIKFIKMKGNHCGFSYSSGLKVERLPVPPLQRKHCHMFN